MQPSTGGKGCATVVSAAVVVVEAGGTVCVDATGVDSLEHETKIPTPTVNTAADRTENRSRMEYDGSRDGGCRYRPSGWDQCDFVAF